ncbi:MAG: PD40 domain-containing protein, partial [Verrucomicrobia bacterium]|nr:PD40 domain-containing protein [Verrucomicrobiota bacterium]
KEDLGRLVIDLAAKASEKATRSVVEWAVDAALPWLKALDVIASFGQAAERFTGFGRTTPLETGFILVGDPFRLEIVSLSPAGAGPGDEMLIVINGARLNPQNRGDAVYFSIAGFQGRILRVQDLGEKRQQLAVRLPEELVELESGEHTVIVVAQGRRGEAAFQLFNRPTVTRMNPTEGFAATDSFLGQRFEGAELSLMGVGFSPDDKFIFGGGVEATNKMGSQGNVTVRVPNGATSSSITIRRQFASGPREGQSPPFTVFGAPRIEGLSPEAGPVGTLLVLNASNLGSNPSVVRVVFGGASPLEGYLLEGNRLAVRVPSDAQSGPIQLLTPAGQTARPFTVAPGRAPGSVIEVGGRSVVSLERALALARGTEPPRDDQDFLIDPKTGDRIPLDPPFEEGDFVTPIQPGPVAIPGVPVGELFADSILVTGEVAASGEFAGEFDILRTASGLTNVIRGTVILTGTNNQVTATIRGSSGHGLVIRGFNNRVSGNLENNAGDGLRIEGGKFNVVGVFALGNGGNGITLTQSAFGNEMAGQSLDNRGHGVALLEDARVNIVKVFATRNGRDGMFLAGTNVRRNQIGNESSENAGHGLLITDGASDNVVTSGLGVLVARKNGKSGVALIGDANTSPRRTQVSAQCNENGEYGVLVSGVVDAWATTHISMTSLDFSTGQLLHRGNRKADLRVENNVSGLHCFGTLGGGPAGIELVGNNVISNLIGASIEGCTSHGVTVTNAGMNRLHLSVANCGGTGVLLSGAVSNLLSVAALGNQGDGLLLTDAARANRLFLQLDAPPLVGTNAFVGNRNGVVLEGAAQDNAIHDFVSNANRENGVLLRGRNTSRNQITKAVIGRLTGQIPRETVGNGGDGIRIEGGASDNAIGAGSGNGVDIRNSAGAGIRIRGPDTRNISVVGSVMTLGDRVQEGGIVVENLAQECAIGSLTAQQGNLISRNADGVIVRGGARRISILNNRIQFNLTNGVLVEAASEVFIGDRGPTGENQISQNATGIQLRGSGTTKVRMVNNSVLDNSEGLLLTENASQNTIGEGNVFTGNLIGIRGRQTAGNLIFGNIIQLSQGDAIRLMDGATDNLLHNNTIRNNGRGVEIDGETAVRNSLRHNSITANGGKGIRLIDGGNAGITPPIIREFRAGVITGTVNAPNGSIVEIFRDPAGEGAESLVDVPCLNGRFQATVQLFLRGIWIPDELTCTVTDLDGNTSEFGPFEPERTGPPSQVAFVSTRDGNSEIYLLRSITALPTRLTSNAADDFGPAFSPNGREIAFASTRTGNSELFIMTLEPGAGARQLTTNAVADYDPAWSSDGTKIVFVSEREGNPDIYVMDASGGTVAPLIADLGVDRSPNFSPDGKKIVFASNRAGNFKIFVADADGRNARAVTQGAAADTQPVWSPSGELIAFVSDRDGNPEIYTMRSDGSSVARLTSDPASDLNPIWLADGSGLVFASDRDAGFELYDLKSTGGEVVRLTVADGDNTSPGVASR